MAWTETILELPCVAEGAKIEVTFPSRASSLLLFRSLGQGYMIAVKTGTSSDGNVEIGECQGGVWKVLGRFSPKITDGSTDPGTLAYRIAFQSCNILIEQGGDIVFQASLGRSPAALVNLAATPLVTASLGGDRRRRNKANLWLPNEQLTIIPMFHYSRCGSTVVSGLLPKENMSVVGEIYSKGVPIGSRLQGTVWEKNRDAWHYTATRLEALFSKVVSAHTPSLLRQPRLFCEIKLNLFTAEVFDFDPRRYFRYLQQRGVKQIVHLRRRNLLRRLVSVRIAREGNIWHLYNNDAPVRRTVFINVDGVVDFDFSRRPRPLRNLLDKTAGDVKFFDKLLREHFEVLELWYEDHVERDPNVAAQAISGLFAVPYSHQQPRVRRQNAGPLDELITNFDDVRKTLRGTPHEYMLEE